MDNLITEHLKSCRNPRILAFEDEAHRILAQCSVKSVCYDNLHADFRYDIICQAYHRFEALGLNLKKLFKFQTKVPAVYPWNIEYCALRFNVNRRFNVFPLVIVMAETECDVIRAYRFARKYNIPISIRGGSHCFEPFSLTQGMIIDQSRRKKFEIKENSVKCEAGVLLGPLVEALFKYRKTLPIGSCPNNNCLGYALGGGIGSLTRVFGLGSDNILKLKIMLADGKVVCVDKTHYPDLFFALRGAGNCFCGIVLSATYRIYDINKVWNFSLSYPLSKIDSVLSTWISFVQTNPVRLTSDIIFTNRGVTVAGFFIDKNKQELDHYLRPLVALQPTEMNMEYIPYLDVVKLNAGLGRWDPFFKFKNAFINPNFQGKQVADIITKYISLAKDADYMVIDNLGGVNNTISPTETAFVHRNLLGWLHINAQWSNEAEQPEKLAWITSFYDELNPYMTPQVYQNAPDLDLVDYLQRYYGENLPRLVEIKKKYDPSNIFNYAQSIPTEL